MRGKMRARAALASLSLLLPGTALAQAPLPEIAPLPFFRPDAPGAAAVDRALTGAVNASSPAAMAKGLVSETAPLATGLGALDAGDVAGARLIRDALPTGSLDRRILIWAIAASGDSETTGDEIADAAEALDGWPGVAALGANRERALSREDPAPAEVLEAFDEVEPQTTEGAILLARAHRALGDRNAARAVLSPFWRTEKLSPREEAAIIAEFGALIPAADHRARMEQMLHHDRIASAQRVAGLAGARELAAAWAAVTRNRADAGKLLDAVPEAQRSAGYIFCKARHLRRQGDYREAAAVMLTAPTDAAALVDPDAWWVERRVLSRELLDIGEAETAYKLAAAHAAESPALAADAEFHAGWYALRSLDDPRTAARHFARIAEIAEGPISLSRAYYWLGRAAEAGAPGDARAYYERAAAHGAAFYGQLAATELGLDMVPAGPPAPSVADRRSFASREAVHAIRRLEQLGYARRADDLYRALAQELTGVGELALLAAMAEERGNHFLALRVGKSAAARGLDVGLLAHPTGAIPATADISSSGKALAYAIARQESEFNVSAKSGAGALGLLQLLPGTARDMARKTGLSFVKARLTTDAAYNATLGAAYLGEQLDRFSGSYVLTFAGYNAGPGRAREWIERYGDPRGKPLETVVDWIERIPFTETRSYVQRVMENYQVYKMRLTGRMDIAADLVQGR